MSRITNLLLAVTFVLFTASQLPAQQWGNLKLQFLYDGTAPKAAPLNITKDQQFCGNKNLVDESLVVDPKTKGLANVILFMYFRPGAKQPPVHPGYAKEKEVKLELANKGCRFEPHVTLLWTQQSLTITNPDAVGHNTKIDDFTNPSNDNLPAGGELKKNFQVAASLPVTVSCSIHPWMKGYLVIKDNPYMAVSDKEGKIEIKNIPAGEWTFRAWQEAAGYVQEVKLGNKKTDWSKGRFEAKISGGKTTDLGQVKVSTKNFD